MVVHHDRELSEWLATHDGTGLLSSEGIDPAIVTWCERQHYIVTLAPGRHLITVEGMPMRARRPNANNS